MSETGLWVPRKSIRLRLEREAEEPGDTISHLASDQFASDFILSLIDEARSVLAELTNDLKALEQKALPDCTIELDVVSWRTRGLAQRRADGGIDLTISLGFCLALDDALLSYLSNGDTFLPVNNYPPDTDEMSVDVQGYGQEYADRATAFFNYEFAQDGQFQPDDVTVAFPIDRWRLRQQDLLFRLGLRWAVLHEFAHAVLGHVDLLETFCKHDTAELAMVEETLASPLDMKASLLWEQFGLPDAPFGPDDGDNVRQAMELQADTCALWLAFDLAGCRGGHGARLFDDYTRDLLAMGVQPETAYTDMHPNRQTHFQFLAALITIGLFERARRASEHLLLRSHPSPEARLINIVQGSFYGSTLSTDNGQGGFEIRLDPKEFQSDDVSNPWRRFLREVISSAIRDFGDFCGYVDVGFNLFLDPEAPRHSDENPEVGVSSWYRDVLELHRQHLGTAAGIETQFKAHSGGGEELLKLAEIYDIVLDLSFKVQIRTKGHILSFPAVIGDN